MMIFKGLKYVILVLLWNEYLESFSRFYTFQLNN